MNHSRIKGTPVYASIVAFESNIDAYVAGPSMNKGKCVFWGKFGATGDFGDEVQSRCVCVGFQWFCEIVLCVFLWHTWVTSLRLPIYNLLDYVWFLRKLRLLAKYCSGNTSAAERAELLGTIFHLFCLTPEVIRGGRCNRVADEFRAREISLRKSVGINTLFYWIAVDLGRNLPKR